MVQAFWPDKMQFYTFWPHRVSIAGIQAISTPCRVEKKTKVDASLGSAFQGYFQSQIDEKLGKFKIKQKFIIAFAASKYFFIIICYQ